MDKDEEKKAEMEKLLSAAEAYCEKYDARYLSLCVMIDEKEIYGTISNGKVGDDIAITRFKKRAQERELQTGA